MRQTTGIERIDRQIAEFVSHEQVYLSGADLYKPVAEWRRCDSGNAACHAISEVFVEFLEEQELDACLSDEARGDEFADGPDVLGYDDRPIKGAPWHTIALVYADEQIFAIDFSAHQFGYDTFPFVQRFDPDSKAWQRSW
jgi:hypothetical protein